MTVTNVWWTVNNGSSNIRNSQNISFLSYTQKVLKKYILLDQLKDGNNKKFTKRKDGKARKRYQKIFPK